MKYVCTILIVFFCYIFSNAQCAAGELEVNLTFTTDAYGYELYWNLVPGGSNCGSGMIAEGGNNAVGCNGGGVQAQNPGGYGNGATITEGPYCLTEGATYTLYMVDDYADGGMSVDVNVNGYIVNSFTITGAGGAFNFTVAEPSQYDLAMLSLDLPIYQPVGDAIIAGKIQNQGQETITSFDINYEVEGGATVTSTISGVSIPNNGTYNFTHPIPWNVTAEGAYSVAVFTSNPNGNADGSPSNDEATAIVEVGAGIPNRIDDYLLGEAEMEEILNSSNELDRPTDLDFFPVLSKKELWVVNKKIESTGGSTVTVSNAGESNQSDIELQDGNAWHFMSMPTAIAFGDNEFFGTAPGVFDANHGQGGAGAFTGPSLWTSNLDIYAQPSGGNGSHMDMLHASSYCQGIAHESGNIYWVFDGLNNDIVRYDFKEDHGPGADDHSDGEILRYSEVTVARDPNDKVVSHMVIDKSTGWLYVVDYGNQRVFRMDINTGTIGATPSYGPFEPLTTYKHMVGYTWENVVTTGLVEPAGIDIIEDRMIVSDYATSEIIIYDIAVMPAVELGRIATPAEGLMGVKIGPEGSIWYTDYDDNKVYKANADDITISVNEAELLSANIFPNPNNGDALQIRFEELSDYEINIFDVSGKKLKSYSFDAVQNVELELALNNGIYLVEINDLLNAKRMTERVTVSK
jgi:hypothetical protein